MLCSLTPFELLEDLVDPAVSMSCFSDALSGLRLPTLEFVNQRFTEMSPVGIVHEDFRGRDSGQGLRVELFRSGYVEMFVVIDRIADIKKEQLREPQDFSSPRLQGFERGVFFERWRETLVKQIGFVFEVWRSCNLPFYDMILSSFLAAEKGTALVIRGSHGRPLEEAMLRCEVKVSKEDDVDVVAKHVGERMIMGFGFKPDYFHLGI